MSEQLLDTLQQDATSLLDQARKAGNNVLLEDTKESIKVLFDIENIYKHSLSSGMFGQSHPWNYLKSFTSIVPNSSDLLSEIKASAKTNDGRLRLFIRLSLNEGNLTSYTRTLVSVKPSIRKHYSEESIMLRDELSARFVEQLSALEHDIQFRLFVKDGSEFDQADYWAQQFKNIQNSISSAASNHVDEDILKIGRRRSVRSITPVDPEQIIEDKTGADETDPEDNNITMIDESISKANSNENTPPIDEPQPSLNEATSDIGSLNTSTTLPEESPPSIVDMSDLEDTMKMLDEIEKTVPDTISQLGSALLKAAIEDDEERLRRDEERLNILDEVFEQQKKEKEDKQKKFTEMNNSRRSSIKLRRSQVISSQPTSTKTSVEITTTTVTSTSTTSPRDRGSMDVDYSRSLKDLHAHRDRSHSQPNGLNSSNNAMRRASASPTLSASTGAIGIDDDKLDNNPKSDSSSTTTSPRAPGDSRPEEKELVDRRPVWIDDKDAINCAQCESKFGLVTRRHHCRNCGKVFCSKCCKDKMPLPQLGYNKPVLVCVGCVSHMQ
eukprot:TRINITY_DN3210_c0_g1_i1.p1 TRINITY_DN3210_c0_g1~~TRINITY_DN3210_c0_g1_i1.p1  ORF type:complete len:553 (+),score=91.08 TRINITY_DN3210_c0_g1_i1:62-1720(+)